MGRIIDAICCGCLLALPLASIGCNGLAGSPDATSSTRTGHVSGRVTAGGQPLAGAQVRFNPSNINRKDASVVTAPIKEDGTFEVTTLVGQNQVSLTGEGVSKNPQLSYFTKTVDVGAGENAFDISIP